MASFPRRSSCLLRLVTIPNKENIRFTNLICQGQHLATLEALIAIVLLTRKYKFTLMPGQEITYQMSLTLPMRYGMKVMVQKRD